MWKCRDEPIFVPTVPLRKVLENPRKMTDLGEGDCSRLRFGILLDSLPVAESSSGKPTTGTIFITLGRSR